MGSYYSGMMNNKDGYGELKHFGILGMKWGVRRFQNADGSLTPAGKERYYSTFEKHYASTDPKQSSRQKSDMAKRSLFRRVSDLYNGRTSGETDSTKVKDLLLRRQMENNIRQNTKLQDNWDFRGKSARAERDLTKKFVDEKVKKYNSSLNKSLKDYAKNNSNEVFRKAMQKRRSDAKRDANEYMRKVAEIRLKSMGYDVTNKAIDNLVSKDWFRNSLWIQNTLASMGADGVDFTSRDDMKFR